MAALRRGPQGKKPCPDKARGRPTPRLREVYIDFVAAKLGGVALDAGFGLLDELSGGHVVLPAVPGATDDGAFEVAFAEGASVVQAYAVDGEELAFEMGDGDGFAVHLEFADGTGGNVGGFGGAVEGHLFPP